MNRPEALMALEERKAQLLSGIPAHAAALRKRYLRNVVEEEIGAARQHLQALYESKLEIGPGFAAMPEHASNPKYSFWAEGINRHLERCQALLKDQPAQQ